MMMSKYHAQRWNGYDSKREAKRAAELKAMVTAGEISDLREQVPFELIPAQYEVVMRTGKRGQALKPKRRCLERACSYIADFVYNKNGEQVVEDAKGVHTPDYIIKRKLMLDKFGIRIQEV